MIKLIKLELQRIHLQVFFMTALIFGILILAFTYFVANVAQIEQETQFMLYENILLFSCVISILCFGIFSAVLYNHSVIKEYSGKRLALLFSYPVSRKKIFTAKVLILFILVSISMLLCTGAPIFIFLATESIAPIVPDVMTTTLFIDVFQTILISVLSVNAVGILSMGIGFMKKSVSFTLISAFLLSGIYGNLMINAVHNRTILLLVAGVSLTAIAAVLIMLSNKINHMEAD